MGNINLHWFEEISERLNIDIDLYLKKGIVYMYWQNCNSVLIVMKQGKIALITMMQQIFD